MEILGPGPWSEPVGSSSSSSSPLTWRKGDKQFLLVYPKYGVGSSIPFHTFITSPMQGIRDAKIPRIENMRI